MVHNNYSFSSKIVSKQEINTGIDGKNISKMELQKMQKSRKFAILKVILGCKLGFPGTGPL
jgi:hypothetical protein